MVVSFARFSALTSDSRVPAGSFPIASSVGANAVNGPGPFRVATSSAAVTAAANVLKEPAAMAVTIRPTSLQAAPARSPHNHRRTERR